MKTKTAAEIKRTAERNGWKVSTRRDGFRQPTAVILRMGAR